MLEGRRCATKSPARNKTKKSEKSVTCYIDWISGTAEGQFFLLCRYWHSTTGKRAYVCRCCRCCEFVRRVAVLKWEVKYVVNYNVCRCCEFVRRADIRVLLRMCAGSVISRGVKLSLLRRSKKKIIEYFWEFLPELRVRAARDFSSEQPCSKHFVSTRIIITDVCVVCLCLCV